jgi:hypothetical protein
MNKYLKLLLVALLSISLTQAATVVVSNSDFNNPVITSGNELDLSGSIPDWTVTGTGDFSGVSKSGQEGGSDQNFMWFKSGSATFTLQPTSITHLVAAAGEQYTFSFYYAIGGHPTPIGTHDITANILLDSTNVSTFNTSITKNDFPGYVGRSSLIWNQYSTTYTTSSSDIGKQLGLKLAVTVSPDSSWGGGEEAHIDTISLSYSAIPEPSTYFAVFSMFSLLLFFTLRRRSENYVKD